MFARTSLAVSVAAVLADASLTGSRRGPSGGDADSVELYADAVGANFMSFTPLHNDAPAFKDLSGSLYKYVPEHLEGVILSTPDRFVSSGFRARFHCPGSRPTPCDAYIFLYECSPCPSQKGALPGQLNANSWERTRCAPQFTTGSGSGKTHKMTSYTKQVDPGTTEEEVLPNDVEFVSFGVSPHPSVDCTGLGTQADCEATKGKCEWALQGAGSCRLARCVSYGPGTGCAASCVGDDLS